MLPLNPNSYEDLRERFKWQIPKDYNIGFDACGKWAQSEPDRLALIYVDSDGKANNYSFSQIYSLAGQLGKLLIDRGVQRGDRVAILLPQAPETAFAHIACYRIAAIALPLFTLFGTDAIQYRLSNSGAKVVITNTEKRAIDGYETFKKAGIEINRMDDESLEHIQNLSNEVMVEVACSSPLAAKVYVSQVEYLAEYKDWRDASAPFNLGRSPNGPDLEKLKACIK